MITKSSLLLILILFCFFVTYKLKFDPGSKSKNCVWLTQKLDWEDHVRKEKYTPTKDRTP